MTLPLLFPLTPPSDSWHSRLWEKSSVYFFRNFIVSKVVLEALGRSLHLLGSEAGFRQLISCSDALPLISDVMMRFKSFSGMEKAMN